MNGNSYYITTSFITCNTDSYYSVTTITVYQTCPNNLTRVVQPSKTPSLHQNCTHESNLIVSPLSLIKLKYVTYKLPEIIALPLPMIHQLLKNLVEL